MQEKDSTVKSLLETEKQLRAALLDGEKFEYFSKKYKKENSAYLEHIDKVSQELHKLRLENKEQKSKVREYVVSVKFYKKTGVSHSKTYLKIVVKC